MKIFLSFSLFAVLLASGVREISGASVTSEKFNEATFKDYSKGVCRFRCEEHMKNCREIESNQEYCESLLQTVYRSHYRQCLKNCRPESKNPTNLGCSYHCLRKAYEESGMTIPSDSAPKSHRL